MNETLTRLSRAVICARVLVTFLLAALPLGCERSSPTAADIRTRSYDTGVTPQTTPTQVVRLAIQGLDEGNTPLLAALVAARDAAEGMNQIYRKYGREGKTTPQAAAAFAAGGWRASYAFFEKGATVVEREKITGDKATVLTRGANRSTGEPATLRFNLIREDGLWKIRPGLHADAAKRQ